MTNFYLIRGAKVVPSEGIRVRLVDELGATGRPLWLAALAAGRVPSFPFPEELLLHVLGFLELSGAIAKRDVSKVIRRDVGHPATDPVDEDLMETEADAPGHRAGQVLRAGKPVRPVEFFEGQGDVLVPAAFQIETVG